MKVGVILSGLLSLAQVHFGVSTSVCSGYPAAPSRSQLADSIETVNQQAYASQFGSVIIEGIVVADLRTTSFNGFYVQAPTSHVVSSSSQSEAIFVYCGTGCNGDNFAEGHFVQVSGTSAVFFGTSQLIDATVQTLCQNPTTVSAACPQLCYQVNIVDLILPIPSLSDYEQYKGMLVHMTQEMTVTNSFTLRFGEIGLSQGGRRINPTMMVEPGTTEYFNLIDEANRRYILMDDHAGSGCPVPQLFFNPEEGLRTGWTLSSNALDATSIMYMRQSQSGNEYKLVPTLFGKDIITSSWNKNANPRIESVSQFVPANAGPNRLRIAGLNCLNYFIQFVDDGCSSCRGADNQAEYDLQSKKLYAAISEMDASVFGLQEIQNLLGDEPVQQLVSELNAYIGQPGKYDLIRTGNVGQDAIKSAIIYQPALVTPVGSHATLTFTNPSDKSRPAIAQTFQPVGCNTEKFTLVVNHLKSKGSACPEDPSGPDRLEGEGNCGFTRFTHAQQLSSWLSTDPTGSGSDNFMLVGDFNTYTEERAIKHFTNNNYVDLAKRDVSSPYSLSFDGFFGTLDYMLASQSMAEKCESTYEWHINSDEPIITDYNDIQYTFPNECKNTIKPDSYHDESPFRSSDHDPILTSCVFSTCNGGEGGGPNPTPFPTPSPVTAPTTGGPDGIVIAFVLSNSDNPDEFAFVALTNIPAGSSIFFTDNGWKADQSFRGGEGIMKWTNQQVVSAGTVVTITDGVVNVGTLTAVSSPIALSASGDQLYAYTSTDSNGNTVQSFVAALNNQGTAWQSDSTNANEGSLPNDLTDGVNAVALDHVDNAKYNGPTSGTVQELLAAINNKANWVGSNADRQVFDLGNFNLENGGGGSTPTVPTNPGDKGDNTKGEQQGNAKTVSIAAGSVGVVAFAAVAYFLTRGKKTSGGKGGAMPSTWLDFPTWGNRRPMNDIELQKGVGGPGFQQYPQRPLPPVPPPPGNFGNQQPQGNPTFAPNPMFREPL